MKKKVLVGYIIAAMIALVAFEYAFWTNGFSYLEHQSEKSYLTQAEMLRDLFQAEEVAGENGYEQFAENYAKAYNIRITIIDSEGNVLGESQGAGQLMSNHLNREEVQKALDGQSNSLIRKSDTFDVDYCYCAVPVDSGDFHGVMRVALPLSELKNMDNEFVRSTVLVTLVLLVVVFFLGAYFRKYVQAMKKVENMRREFVSNV
ncbi:MAG: hypothetical protein EGQ17_05220, partial [Lachnospiraceae bacterium]|nr:hypothetical protein [Lachnospiraceae bacterium]